MYAFKIPFYSVDQFSFPPTITKLSVGSGFVSDLPKTSLACNPVLKHP